MALPRRTIMVIHKGIRRSKRDSATFPVLRWLQIGAVTAGVGVALGATPGIAAADDGATTPGSSSPDSSSSVAVNSPSTSASPATRNRSRSAASRQGILSQPTRRTAPPAHVARSTSTEAEPSQRSTRTTNQTLRQNSRMAPASRRHHRQQSKYPLHQPYPVRRETRSSPPVRGKSPRRP